MAGVGSNEENDVAFVLNKGGGGGCGGGDDVEK
jgi:hypothetical protein